MKFASIIIVTLLLGTMFLSLFSMTSSMEMSGGMSDCLFMMHDEVLCPMDIAEHLGAWQSIFLTTVPSILVSLVVVGVVGFVYALFPGPRKRYNPVLILFRLMRENTYTFSYRPLQELFASGILHSKAY